MLTVKSEIRRHFASLPAKSLVCRQHLLRYGNPCAVDMAIYHMVKAGTIVRIAWGIFAREGFQPSDFSVEEVATAKAAAFEKTIARDGSKLVEKFELKEPDDATALFAINRGSSKFRFNDDYIYLKPMSGKKEKLTDDGVGQVIKALWAMGESAVDEEVIEKLIGPFGAQKIKPYYERSHLMPFWLITAFRSAAGFAWEWNVRSRRQRPAAPFDGLQSQQYESQ